MEDIFFKVLNIANEKGLFNSVNVSLEIKEILIAGGIHQSKPINWWRIPYDLINPLKELGYIHYIIVEPENQLIIPENWIDLINLHIMITPSGQEFLLKHKSTKLQIEINTLTLKKMKGFEFKVWLSIAIAGFSALFAGYPIFKNSFAPKQSERQKLHEVSKQQSPKKQLSTKENPKASPDK